MPTRTPCGRTAATATQGIRDQAAERDIRILRAEQRVDEMIYRNLANRRTLSRYHVCQ